MTTLFLIILATVLVSLLSLIGALTLFFKEEILKKITIYLVALSAGAFIGGAFLHLIPEAIHEIGKSMTVMIWVIVGFIIFLIFEQFIHWHHCHRMPSEHKHPVTYMILFSDTLHNFLDGLTIGAAFLINPTLGWATTLAVAAHELPQELGDFGILIHGGWKKVKALMFNLFSGLAAVLGGILVWTISGEIEIIFLLPFAAGNFIYIAAADLIPEFKHCKKTKLSFILLLTFVLGIMLMYGMLFIEVGHGHGVDHGHETGISHEEERHHEESSNADHVEEHEDEEHHNDEHHE